MRHKGKLLAAALLAVSVSSAVAAPQVLSEEELGDVSAQGIQVITNPTDISAQQNNNDSVQLNGTSQSGSSGTQITNNVNSAENVNTNVVSIDSSSFMSTSQLSNQFASNTESSEQYIDNNASATDQNNNNASVQINDDSQTGINVGVASNMAASAGNIAQNIGSITNSDTTSLGQTNIQTADNSGSSYQGIYNGGTAEDQENNNASVQLNDNAQSSSNSMVLDNSSMSAHNVAQNVIYVDGLDSSLLSQANTQHAENVSDADQQITNDGDARFQNNNNGSVQVNGNAQTDSNGMVIKNTAFSAQNVGQNILSGQNLDGVNVISQLNDQTAINGAMDPETASQEVVNQFAELQNNNNASVQLNENAQANTGSMAMLNTSNSASNTAQNIVDVSGGTSVNIITSSNIQTASNYTRWSVEQDIATGDSDFQRNNTNSVQLNDNAQNSSTGMAIANAAGSASNIGQNVGLSTEITGFNTILQFNEQYAYNGTSWGNWSFQDVENNNTTELITRTRFQDNNNASVQLNDGTTAQDNVNTMILSNTAHSASNIAQNAAIASNIFAGNVIAQENYQEAYNDTWTVQTIGNNGLVNVNIAQDNNNSSVQVLSGQNDVNAMAMLNTSNSASNTAQNLFTGYSLVGFSGATQDNEQYTSNFAESTQLINNNGLVFSHPIAQFNNNGSVQVWDGQNNFNGMVGANTSMSSVNIAQNVGSYEFIADASIISQYNYQESDNATSSYQGISNESLTIEADLAQDNNNASVQINGGQNDINAMSFSNIASSASNIAQNVANIDDSVGVDLVAQMNEQYAYNYTEGGQTVTNSGTSRVSVSIAQDNNNASVQLNGSQNNVSTTLLQNSAVSATNVGQNIVSLINPEGFSQVTQENIQEASNEFYLDDHTITNDFAIAQDNNNGSIQLNDAQNGVSSLMTLNSAVSAVNVGMNIADVNGSVPFGTIVSQSNIQTAENDLGGVDTSQTVNNNVVILGQDNNNGSVQLNNSQVGTTGMVILNTANSATNVGLNIANITGASGWTINQTTIQSAINY
ncbi:beta strand repeat-containing protein [Persephonella sp.]